MTSDKRENKITLSHILSIKPDCKRRINDDTLILDMIWEGGMIFRFKLKGKPLEQQAFLLPLERGIDWHRKCIISQIRSCYTNI